MIHNCLRRHDVIVYGIPAEPRKDLILFPSTFSYLVVRTTCISFNKTLCRCHKILSYSHKLVSHSHKLISYSHKLVLVIMHLKQKLVACIATYRVNGKLTRCWENFFLFSMPVLILWASDFWKSFSHIPVLCVLILNNSI